MSPSPPELFPQRPIRSDFGRGPSYRTRRVLTICVCLCLIGFILYRAFGGIAMAPGGIPTIKAETGSWKQRPETPGGIDIPHQDVEVYQALDNKDTASRSGVEHLLPPPETPQPSAINPIASSTNQLQSVPAHVIPKQPENLAPQTTSIESIMGAPPLVPTTVEPPPTQAVKPAPVEQPVVAAPVKPEAVKPVSVKPQTIKPAPAKPDAMEQVLKDAIKSGKTVHVQLAATQDEDSANQMMEKMQTRYASVLGDAQLHVIRADLGDKGIYYRIRAEVISDGRANSHLFGHQEYESRVHPCPIAATSCRLFSVVPAQRCCRKSTAFSRKPIPSALFSLPVIAKTPIRSAS